jgi:hypothetical protein
MEVNCILIIFNINSFKRELLNGLRLFEQKGMAPWINEKHSKGVVGGTDTKVNE